jgi:hypothetical protein
MSKATLLGVAALLALPLCASAQSADSGPTERDLNVVQHPYADIVPVQTGHLRVEASVNHRSRVYRIGEDVRISVSPNEDAYIHVFDIGSSGRMTQLFPNKCSHENFVHGGDTLVIPDSDDCAIRVSGPPGVDVIKVIASKFEGPVFHGHLTEGGAFGSVDEDAPHAVRDLDVVLNTEHKAQPWAEARIFIRTVDDDHAGMDSDDEGGTVHHLNGGTEADALAILGNLPRHSGFGIRLELNHDDGVYDKGDSLRVRVTPDRDCNLKLIDVGSSGEATIVFPNRAQRRAHVERDETVVIPAEGSDVAYKVRGPGGLEELVAVCRADERSFFELPWDWSSNSFQSYPGGEKSFQRDLDVVVHDGDRGAVGYAAASFRIEH